MSDPSPYADLSRREREIMDVLFRRGEATASEVRQGMPNAPSDSAVRWTLRALESKGRITHRQEGPRYVYVPVTEPRDASTAALQHVVKTFFGGAADKAVTALLSMQATGLSEEEIRRLTDQIRKAREEGR